MTGKKYWLIGLGLILLLAVGLVFVVPPSRYIVIGSVRGENFYHGWPVSYWKHVARASTEDLDDDAPGRTDSLMDKFMRYLGYDPDNDDLMARLGLEEKHDPALVPLLVELLEDEDYRVAQAAFEVMENAEPGEEAKMYMPVLLRMLKHPDPRWRLGAVGTLELFGPDAEEAVPLLIERLKDDDTEVSIASAQALGRIGPKAKQAIPALREAMESDKMIDDPAMKASGNYNQGAETRTLRASAKRALTRIDRERDGETLDD